MRISIATILCLIMLSSFAYGEPPTKTLAQGGWFAIGGPISPGQTVATYCAGQPCTDQNFANAYGGIFTGLMPSPGMAHYYETRRKAEDALMNGEFSLGGTICQPMANSGQAGIVVSGYAQYYTLGDFSYAQLQQAVGLPSSEARVNDFTNAIFSELTNKNLSSLAPNSNGPLVDQDDGQMINNGSFPISFTDLDSRLYTLIERWAKEVGAVVNAFKVTRLETSDFICP